MPHPSQNEEFPDPVQAVAADFEACARRAIECLLNRPTLLSKPFSLQAQTIAEPGIRCFIECGDGGQALRISVGLSKSDLRILFPDEKDEEMALDAIGEILNIVAGTLFGRPGFRSKFGCMRASVPNFGAPSFQMGKARTIRGALLVGSARLILELAVDSGKSGGEV